MAVPLGKRGESKLEFLHILFRLQKSMTLLFIRDFGVKSISRDLRTFTYAAKMPEKDRELFIAMCSKYHIDVESEWPLWLIEHYRMKLISILDSMEENVVTANTIYPNYADYEYWHNLRRKHQKLAQADCYRLLRAMQNICYILPVDKERLMPYVELIQQELEAIKSWQKRTNAQYKKHCQNMNN